ncbi:hypothetical protein H920_05619 [Fukomys damarensis]|uniref:Uncharacterized protein n=1 Tax=Fukomys damarensis TaxID=885580 RepID=A0A091DR97_FUKDA|nr:hypothetical protein H920_05619 [Fukomys damarensis]
MQPAENGHEEARIQSQQPPQRGYRCNFTSITDEDAQRIPNQERAKRLKQRSTCPEGLTAQAEQAGLSKPRLNNISTMMRFSPPARRNKYKIPAIANEQDIGNICPLTR